MTQRCRSALLVVIILVWLAWSGAYLVRSAVIVNGVRTFTLFDDAMISMTYARTLAQGHGLVWYPGAPRVEGITNPLWTLYMAALHLTGLPDHLMSLPVQLSGLLLLALNLLLCYRLARALGGSATAGAIAVFLVAAHFPLNMWALQGMEVAALAPLVTGCLLLAVRLVEERRACSAASRKTTWLYALLGIGILIRPDAAVLVLGFGLLLAWLDAPRRRAHLLYALGTLALVVGTTTLLRLWYYGDPFPNTYYLKMTGFPALYRISRGVIALGWFVWNTNWLLVVLPFLGAWLLRLRRAGFVLGIVTLQMLWSAYAGGDAWEWTGGANRYLAVVMPGFLCVFAALAVMLRREIVARNACGRDGGAGSESPSPRHGGAAGRLVMAALLILVALDFAIPADPRAAGEMFLLRPTLQHAHNEGMVRLGLMAKEVTTPEAVVGVVWAGATPYFAHRPAVDLLGKSDRHIARLQVPPSPGLRRFREFFPGHMKWDMSYTLNVQRPDFIPLLFKPMIDAGGAELQRRYAMRDWHSVGVMWRRDSTKILHPQLERALAAPLR